MVNCFCRVWNNGLGTQCKRKIEDDTKCCKQHNKLIGDDGWWLGFIDEERPEHPMKDGINLHYWSDQEKPKKVKKVKKAKEPKKAKKVKESIEIINKFNMDKCDKLFIKNYTTKYNLVYKDYEETYYKIKEIFNNNNYDEILETELVTSQSEQSINDEVSTPYELSNKILSYIDKEYFLRLPRILDYCCGKGSIIFNTFKHYYNILEKHGETDKLTICKTIIESYIFIGDINHTNVFTTMCLIMNQANKYTGIDYDYKFNIYVGSALDLNLYNAYGINNVNGVFVNPPFHDEDSHGKTQHKIWIDLTIKTFNEWLGDDGLLYQISPESFSSPSNKILNIMKEKNTKHIHFNQRDKYFPKVGTTISWYLIENKLSEKSCKINDNYELDLSKVVYIPNDPRTESIGIHNKVMFSDNKKIDMKYDYVTCHNNILLKATRANKHSTISRTETETHIYPVFHTNKQVWYSELKQDIFDKKKVMWTRSGYAKPFYDKGTQGITDLAYYILVDSDEEGYILEHNMNSKLFNYILKSAKWSGFGNDKVFRLLPELLEKKYSDIEIYEHFKLSDEEISYLI